MLQMICTQYDKTDDHAWKWNNLKLPFFCSLDAVQLYESRAPSLQVTVCQSLFQRYQRMGQLLSQTDVHIYVCLTTHG